MSRPKKLDIPNPTRWLLVASLAVLGSSCAVTSPQEINEKYRSFILERQNQYVVKPGDTVTMRNYQGPVDATTGSSLGDLAVQESLVLPDGRTDPFFMPNYRMEGKTLPEIEDDVRDLLSGGEILKPEDISMSAVPAPETVYLTGEFLRPGPLTLENRMTVYDAIAAGLGLNVTGDTDYALLIRQFGNEPGIPERFRIDLNDEATGIILLPGDIIHLPRNAMATIVVYLREFVFGVIPGQLYSGAIGGALAF